MYPKQNISLFYMFENIVKECKTDGLEWQFSLHISKCYLTNKFYPDRDNLIIINM